MKSMKLVALVIAVVGISFLSLADEGAIKKFHHCAMIGGTGNTPHLFDTSEVYACDEGKIEIAGQTRQVIEYGYVFSTELGRPGREQPYVATEYDYKWTKWCPTPTTWDKNQKERCGDKPVICWDGKLATWDKTWQGHSCVTPDHQGKP